MTKTLGIRRIRLCKACGHKFTPKNQKPSEMEEHTAEPTTAHGAGNSMTQVAAATPTPHGPTASNEAIDHPRF